MCKFRGAEDLELGRRMAAQGVPLDLGEFQQQPLIVHQDRHDFSSSIASAYFTSGCMGTTVTAFIRIANSSELPLALCDIQLSLRSSETPVILLPDPADHFSPQIYKFPGERSGGFVRSQVLPRSGKMLSRGGFVEGFLLGYTYDAIPAQFRHGMEMKAVLTVENQLGQILTEELVLKVDRTAERACRKPKTRSAHARAGLFDKPDPPKPNWAGRTQARPVCEAMPVETPKPKSQPSVGGAQPQQVEITAPLQEEKQCRRPRKPKSGDEPAAA